MFVIFIYRVKMYFIFIIHLIVILSTNIVCGSQNDVIERATVLKKEIKSIRQVSWHMLANT